jgi:DNA replication protein
MTFEGFPAGELEYISVPDLFFTQLVPKIDNLAELKVVLHLIWLRQRRGRQAVSWAELVADETLASSLASLGDPESVLEEGLEQALTGKSVLHILLQSHDETQDIYALNSESGRRALAAVKEGHIGVRGVVVMDRPSVEPRPNIFELYEDNIGLISPILADELRDAEATYPADWVEDAFRIAAANNVRKWRYILAILERWATQGKDDGTNWKSTETERRWYTDEEYEQFFEH